MKKKVIFVGGMSYSGSTFFHLTLANDPKGFGIGEVKHLFRPTKERHTSASWVCGCGNPTCRLWSRVKKNGERRLYQSVFETHPEIDFIVDASKNVSWITTQTKRLARQGIETRHIVIWKTLLEYAHSLHKRNRLYNKSGGELIANRSRYHRMFYSLLKDFRTVKYGDYARDQAAVLKAACCYLGIPYFQGKERFWAKTHHALGGNLSSRIHLYAKESDGYGDVQRRARHELGAAETNYRRIYYDNPHEGALVAYVSDLRRKLPYIDIIEDMLSAHDVRTNRPAARRWPELEFSPIELRIRQLRQIMKERVSRVRFAW